MIPFVCTGVQVYTYLHMVVAYKKNGKNVIVAYNYYTQVYTGYTYTTVYVYTDICRWYNLCRYTQVYTSCKLIFLYLKAMQLGTSNVIP